MSIYWGTRVTKLARVLLEERRYYATSILPVPQDLATSNRYINDVIAGLKYDVKDKENYRQVAVATEAKLVIYNRRRTGELQAIR